MHPPTFSQWLKRLRAQLDLTQETLAELVDCSVQTIRALEIGKRRASVALAERLADVLEVPPEQRADFVRLARSPVNTSVEADERAPSSTPSVTTLAPVSPVPVTFSLPSVATPLIGRAAEISQLRRLLVEEQRIVTIVGPGGIGKTRLALDLTATLAGQFTDGAAFVSLAAINHVQHLPSAIASTLNIPLYGALDLQQQVNAWLAPRHLLLTLDNFEQLLAQPGIAEWMRQLLTAAPHLHLLITSRERLRVSGERIFELGGLPLPEPNRPLDQADALLLFLGRAQQAVADFVLNAQNQAVISRICQLVEGMPLGIELAAAWVNVLPLADIADEISRSIDFLARSNRDMAPRHRSMRAVFDHSWHLLSEAERQVLMKLSIFRGGCTREAAQQVAEATLPLLASLIDKSLLRKSQTTPSRYFMHELVRQYAADRLQAAAELATIVGNAHAEYYHQLVSEAEQQLWGANIAETVNRLDTENDNLRAALNHYLADPAGAQRSLQLGGSLWRFWEIRGYIAEGRAWLEQALQKPVEPPPAGRWLALHGAGNLALDQGDYAIAKQHYGESLHLLQTHLQVQTDPDVIWRTRYRIANTLTNLGHIAFLQSEWEQAVAFTEEALALHRELQQHPGHSQFNRKIGLAVTMTNLAKIKLWQKQLDQAERFGAESLALYQELGDERGIGWNLTTLGAIARERGDYAQATRLYLESKRLFEKLANQADMAGLHFDLGELARAQGDYTQAEAQYQTGFTLAQTLGNKKDIALLADRLSLVACQAGRHAEAINLNEQSVALHRELGNRLGLSEALQRRDQIADAQAAHNTLNR